MRGEEGEYMKEERKKKKKEGEEESDGGEREAGVVERGEGNRWVVGDQYKGEEIGKGVGE